MNGQLAVRVLHGAAQPHEQMQALLDRQGFLCAVVVYRPAVHQLGVDVDASVVVIPRFEDARDPAVTQRGERAPLVPGPQLRRARGNRRGQPSERPLDFPCSVVLLLRPRPAREIQDAQPSLMELSHDAPRTSANLLGLDRRRGGGENRAQELGGEIAWFEPRFRCDGPKQELFDGDPQATRRSRTAIEDQMDLLGRQRERIVEHRIDQRVVGRTAWRSIGGQFAEDPGACSQPQPPQGRDVDLHRLRRLRFAEAAEVTAFGDAYERRVDSLDAIERRIDGNDESGAGELFAFARVPHVVDGDTPDRPHAQAEEFSTLFRHDVRGARGVQRIHRRRVVRSRLSRQDAELAPDGCEQRPVTVQLS